MPDTPDGGAGALTANDHETPTVSDADYRALVDQIPDAVIVHQDARIVFCNVAASELFGAGSGLPLAGRHMDSLLHPDAREAIRTRRGDAANRQQWVSGTRQFLRLDGTTFIAEGSASRLKLDGVATTLVIVRDISERIRVETALRENEEKYRIVTENAADAIFLNDAEGRFVEVNDRAATALGYNRDEILGLSILDIDSRLTADDLAANVERMSTGSVATVESEHRRKDGTTFPVEVRGNRISLRGQSFFLNIVRDITDRKRAEQALLQTKDDRLADFTASSNERFWETDATHRLVFSSAQSSSRTLIGGDEPVTEAIGRHIWEQEGVDPNSDIWRQHIERLDAREPFTDFRWTRADADGCVHHLRSSGMPVFDDDGAFTGFRGSTVDETTHVEAQEQAQQLEQSFFEAMENISEGFALWDADHRFVACNSHFVASRPDLLDVLVPGIRFEDVMRHQAELGHFPEAVGRIDEWVAEVSKRHRQQAEPYEMLRDGRWYHVRGHLLDDGSVLAFQRDVTESKEREAALRESEEQFRTAFESSAVGMALASPEAEILVANQTFADMLGYTREELASLRIAEISHPDDRVETNRVRADIFAGAIDRHTMEKRYLRKDGGVVWAITSVALVRDSVGEPKYAVVQVQDITARRAAEEALRDSEETARVFLDATFDTATLLDPDGTIIATNEATALRMGLTPEDMRGTNIFNYLNADVAAERRERFDEVVATGNPLREQIDKATGIDGDRWIAKNIWPLKNEAGEVYRIATFTRDVTEQINGEQELRESEETARAFLNATFDSAVLLDREGKLIALNEAAALRFGLPMGQLVGTNVYDRRHRSGHHPRETSGRAAPAQRRALSGHLRADRRRHEYCQYRGARCG